MRNKKFTTQDEINDLKYAITNKLVKEGIIEDCTDTDSEVEVNTENAIEEILIEFLGTEDNDCPIGVFDVQKVANDLNISVTDEQIREVLSDYNDEMINNPTSTWFENVENLLYNL